jgi:hypothetical protein
VIVCALPARMMLGMARSPIGLLVATARHRGNTRSAGSIITACS